MQIFEGEALLRQRLHDLEVNNMAAMQRLIKESEDSMAALKKHRSSSGEWASWVLGSLRDHPSAFEHSHCPSYGAHCSSYLYTSTSMVPAIPPTQVVTHKYTQVGKPPTFAGKVKPNMWINKIMQFFQSAHVPPSDYLLHALPLLELNTPADHWYRSIQNKYTNMTWDLFVVLITQHFTRDQRDTQQACRDDLHSGKIQQNTNSHMYNALIWPLWRPLTCQNLIR